MILGMTPFTFFHTAISLIGILSGFVILAELFTGKLMNGWTAIFLATTVATSATGFGFPFFGVLPSHIIGGISLVVLAVAIVARYVRHLAGPWRWVYAVGAVVALYFNVFVLVVQLFRRVPALNVLAPTQSEPPFAIVEGVVFVLFAFIGVRAVRRFRPAMAATSRPMAAGVPR